MTTARLREALELVLLFHSGGPWGDAKTDRWKAITGRYRPNFGSNTDSDEVTTRAMCDHIRKVLEVKPPAGGKWLQCGDTPAEWSAFVGEAASRLAPDSNTSEHERTWLTGQLLGVLSRAARMLMEVKP